MLKLAGVSLLSLASAAAFADVPAAVGTTFTEIGTDIGTVGGYVIVAALAVVAIMYLKGMIKR